MGVHCVMKNAVFMAVDEMFDKLPFSKKNEEIKNKLREQLAQKYENAVQEGVNEFEAAGKIISMCNNLKSACEFAECGEEMNNTSLEKREVIGISKARKIFNRLRKSIVLECVLLFSLLQQGQVLVVGSKGEKIFSAVFSIVCLLLIFVVNKKKSKYYVHCKFENLRFDSHGRDYIFNLHDEYSKKLLNSIFILIGAIFYIIFISVFSVIEMKYTFLDVFNQIMFFKLIMDIVITLLIKNLWCKSMLDIYFISSRKNKYTGEIKKLVCVFIPLLAAVEAIPCLLHNKIKYVNNWVIAVCIIYAVLCVFYNFTLRSGLVYKNIVVKPKKIICLSLIAAFIVSYNFMSLDLFLTQTYINTVSNVMAVEDDITYDEKTGVYTITIEKENFKILQLTDIHLGGSFVSVDKDLKALKACFSLIEETKPDFVVVTGDLVFPMGIMSFSLNNNAPVMQFASFMRNTGIPWAFTYGNHDTESMATLNEDEFDELMQSLSYKSSCNLLYPYKQPDIYGRNNQIIEIRNNDGSLMQALFLIDSNDYIQGSQKVNEYDYIHDDQVQWYRENVEMLKQNNGGNASSMIFIHIPIEEYKDANDLYEAGSNEVKYHYGLLGETMIDKICCPNHESTLFEAAVALGSTKAIFCGHDHYNNQSLEYKGIRLTYGYSIDYLAMPGIENDVEQRGATLITIDKLGNFEITPYRLCDLLKSK